LRLRPLTRGVDFRPINKMADAKKNTVTVQWKADCLWKHKAKKAGAKEELSASHADAAVHLGKAELVKE
jgi:hypothetical protein